MIMRHNGKPNPTGIVVSAELHLCGEKGASLTRPLFCALHHFHWRAHTMNFAEIVAQVAKKLGFIVHFLAPAVQGELRCAPQLQARWSARWLLNRAPVISMLETCQCKRVREFEGAAHAWP